MFVGRGGDIKRASIQHISQVLDGAYSSPPGRPPNAVITCLGLGAYWLGGVEDKDVYPLRGQTVLIDAPWVRFGRSMASPDGHWTYIIPRKSGGVRLRQREIAIDTGKLTDLYFNGTSTGDRRWYQRRGRLVPSPT